jgi:hypothetical protein
MNLNMKVTRILCHWFLLLYQFRFCETHFTTYQGFVADQSAISPSLGGGPSGPLGFQKLVFGLLCRHTVSELITSDTHKSGAQ